LQAKRLPAADHGAHDRLVIGIASRSIHERFVDLRSIDRVSTGKRFS